MVDDDRNEIGHAERVTLHQGFTAELGSATCAASRAARPRSDATAGCRCTLGIVERADAYLWRLGMRSTAKRPAPTTPRGSKTAHADFLNILKGVRAGPRSLNTLDCPGGMGRGRAREEERKLA
jgi:hypothetical protein